MPEQNMPTEFKKILWFASWYPNALNPLNGDFVQRHAQAVARFCRVEVWAFAEDRLGKITQDFSIQTRQTGNLTENIVFIKTPQTPAGILDNFLGREMIYNKAIRIIDEKIQEKPVLVHTHVALYAGRLGMHFSRKWQVPHVVTEHFTGYLPVAKPNFRQANPLTKSLWRKIMRSAHRVLPVSETLKNALKDLAPFPLNMEVIPNVVNGETFRIIRQKPDLTTFITISADNWQKNIPDVIEACRLLNDSGQKDFRLIIVDSETHRLLPLVNAFGLSERIQLCEPMPQPELAQLMAHSHCTIMYSRFETFGCVVIESLAGGVPVIISDIPVLRERIVHGKNGWIAEPENPRALAAAMKLVMDSTCPFNPDELREETLERYAFDPVGKRIADIYAEMPGWR